MIAIEQFLSNIKPFDCTGNLNRFLEELEKIPNYRGKLAKEIENNPQWLEAAERTRDESGYHVFFYLDHSFQKSGKRCVNTIALRVFSEGKQPTIKVTVYDRY